MQYMKVWELGAKTVDSLRKLLTVSFDITKKLLIVFCKLSTVSVNPAANLHVHLLFYTMKKLGHMEKMDEERMTCVLVVSFLLPSLSSMSFIRFGGFGCLGFVCF